MPVITVRGLRAEYGHPTLGIGTAEPRLSWWVAIDESDGSGVAAEPTASEIRLLDADTGDELDGAVHRGTDSRFVAWPFTPLRSRQRVEVQVRAVEAGGGAGPWSQGLVIEAGLLSPDDWRARPIAAAGGEADPRRPVLFRRVFDAPGGVVGARLYLSALGVHQAEINGHPVGDEVLAPGWTSYHHRLRYQALDVTDLVTPGANAIGVVVAEGWYRGRVGFDGGVRELYGSEIGPIVQLELRRADGTIETITTDEAWRAGEGPWISAGLYDGERYDARLHDPAWSSPGFDDAGWRPTRLLDEVASRLEAPLGPPIRRVEELRPVAVEVVPSGGHLLDFGQNISGRLRIMVDGPEGTTIVIRHAEVLEHGELGVRPLRGAAATDSVILPGGPITWEPTFTIHGFRYATVEGWPGELRAEDVVAVACHSDMEPTGRFSCSDSRLEQLHENARWSMRGNFVDIPTDCPQRDERLGWTGDIQVFAPTASFLYDCNGFLASWLRDVAVEQQELGTVPAYVPWVPLLFPVQPTAAWSDAAVIVPWVLYQRFGDRAVLEHQYPSMTAWVDEIVERSGPGHLWDEGFQFGDWLDPAAPPDQPGAARTDPSLVATAYHAHTLRLVAEVAGALGRDDDHRRYATLAAEVRAAFRREYVTPSGRLASDAQTAYALAIGFDLLEADQRSRAGDRLAELVVAEGHHIGTGFVGTPLVCDALADTGHLDTAYHLLTQESCPSWLYPVTMGATTIWERWDSMLPDGSINPGEMTSFNHYALGAVIDFLHRVVAGLSPTAPGYQRLAVRPRPGGGLVSAGVQLRSPYGPIRSSWRRDGEELELDLEVPVGVTATIEVPDGSTSEVGGGRHRLRSSCRAVADDPPRPPHRSLFGIMLEAARAEEVAGS
jgi:alpha-L-rhamnosidase